MDGEEVTDPLKFIPEDIYIAAYLDSLPTRQQGIFDHGRQFVDLGCGNGVLTYILNRIGWRGYGVDARRRKLWDSLDDGTHRGELRVRNTAFLSFKSLIRP